MTKEEAIEVYYGLINPKIKEAFEFFAPELCENEDERIRKKCIELIKRVIPSGDSNSQESKEILDCIAYLERQKDVWRERAQNITANMLEDRIEGIQRELIEFLSNAVDASWVDIIQSADGYAERIRNIIEKQKEQKPILEVFGFKVGDAVRLKDGDGRKHIIKSFEEVEGVHGPNFYHVEFEDDSARDGIYPGEEYPNGYYTQMEKIEEEQKPSEEEIISKLPDYTPTNLSPYIEQSKKWSENEKKIIGNIRNLIFQHAFEHGDVDVNGDYCKDVYQEADNFLKSLRPQPKQEWSDEEKDKLNRIERIIVNANAHGNSLIGDKEAIELQHFIRSLVKPVINIVEWSEDKEIIRQNGRLDVCYNPEKYGLCNKTESIKDATKFGNLEYERGVKDGIQSEKKRHWKPSEKQLIALRYYLNNVPYSLHKEHLSSLRDDCEKLFIQ